MIDHDALEDIVTAWYTDAYDPLTDVVDPVAAASLVDAILDALTASGDLVLEPPTPPISPTPFEWQLAIKNNVRYKIDDIIDLLNASLTVDTTSRDNAYQSLEESYSHAETAIGKERPIS